jgi:non-heme chloroperoxidase
VLIGCCSGTGEIIRYLRSYGLRRVRAAALLAPLSPSLPRYVGIRDGADLGILDVLIAELTVDRPAAVKSYLDLHYNIDLLGGDRVTDQAWQNSFHTALQVSAAAALGCALALREDFRADLPWINCPVLVVQGDQDRLLSLEAAGEPLAHALPDADLVVIPGGPPAITWTHAAEVDAALADFLRAL